MSILPKILADSNYIGTASEGRMLTSLRVRPITASLLFATALYSLWMAAMLYFDVARWPQLVIDSAFQGPVNVMSITTWSALYLGTGIVFLSRVFFFNKYRVVDMALHVVSSLTILLWAASFLIQAPLSTSQPTSTFIAALVMFLPYITSIIERSWTPRINRVVKELDKIVQHESPDQ